MLESAVVVVVVVVVVVDSRAWVVAAVIKNDTSLINYSKRKLTHEEYIVEVK